MKKILTLGSVQNKYNNKYFRQHRGPAEVSDYEFILLTVFSVGDFLQHFSYPVGSLEKSDSESVTKEK